jgi:hypothetical protein
MYASPTAQEQVAMQSVQYIRGLLPNSSKALDASLSLDELITFVRTHMGYEFVTGGQGEDPFLLNGTADAAEVDELKSRLHEMLPDLKIRYFFRPRPLCYYAIESADTWETVSRKAYGTELFALTIYWQNLTLYLAHNLYPDAAKMPPVGEYVYIPRIK